MNGYLLVCVVLVLVNEVASQDPPFEPCERGFLDRGESCYWFSTAASFGIVNWFEARTDCQRMGGELASIADQGEMDFIENFHDRQGRRPNNYWIGATAEPYRNGTYGWSDGTTWNTQLATDTWGAGRPRGEPFHCGFLWGGNLNIGTWNDNDCDNDDLLFLCKFPKHRECTCGINESKQCDIGFACLSYRVCESGRVITVECPDGRVVDANTLECRPELEVPPPCGIYRNCTGMADASYPILEDQCRTYYRCQGGNIQLEGRCPDGNVFDQTRQVCDDREQVCAPCGRATSTPIGPCPGPTYN